MPRLQKAVNRFSIMEMFMKKHIRLLTLGLALAVGMQSAGASANHHMGKGDGLPNRNVGLSVDAISWTYGAFNTQLELALADNLSLTIPLNALVPYATFFRNNTFPTFGWLASTGVGAKFYVTGKSLCHGFYVHGQLLLGAGEAGLPALNQTTVKPAGAVFAFAGDYSVKTGYTWVSSGGLMLDAFAGAHYAMGFTKPLENIYNGLGLQVGALVGYAW
jgi:hypothetical protein